MGAVPDRRTFLGLAALLTLGGCAVTGRGGRPREEKGGQDVQRISYGEDPSQYGELSVPEGASRGVVVVIHGGFWKAQYDLSLGRPLAASLVEQGWTVWNLEYRRVGISSAGGGGGVPETLDDIAAGIDALADVPGLDTSTLVTLGHSAGGHLATWAASRGRFERWSDRVPVTAVISQAGVLDLQAGYDERLGANAVVAFLDHAPGPDDAPVDPRQQLPLDVPVWCVHGRSDDIVPISQSEAYVAAATAAGARAELVAIDGDHFTVIDPTSGAWAQTLAILDTLG